MVGRNSSPDQPLIPQYYAGKTVLLTGGTGFMGKVLVERLLRTCPDISRILLLMRQKREVSPEKRLLHLKQSEVFDGLRSEYPHQLDKIFAVPGDTALPGLGIDDESLALLQEVSMVFHCAATLKFDEPLGTAVEQNVRSVVRLMSICDTLPNLQAFVHVSTAYSNAELRVVEERVYPPPAPLDQVLALVDAVPDELLADITGKFISPKPNTYTFTKALAETAVQRHGAGAYPVAIFRPTIVIASHRHPFPGWSENLNGPSGVIVGVGKGLLHVSRCKLNARADLLPVDIAIDCLIAVGWETAVDKCESVRVYNCSSCENPTTWDQFRHGLHQSLRDAPLEQAVWYPFVIPVESAFLHKLLELLLQTAPLFIAEYAAKFCGIELQFSLITAGQKLRAMSDVLQFFTINEWRFATDNVRRLRSRLSRADRDLYNVDINNIHWDKQYTNFVRGTKKYLLKEKDENITEAKRRTERLRFIHHIVLLVLLVLLYRLFVAILRWMS